MAKSVYVPEAGGIIDFPDDATPQQMLSYIKSRYSVAKEPALTPPEQEIGPWESSGLGWLSKIQTAGGGFSEAIGAEEAAKYLYEKAQKNLEESQKYQPEERSITGAETWGGSAEALQDAAIQSAPDLAGGLAAGYVGGQIGAGIGAFTGPAAPLAIPIGATAGALIGAGLYSFGVSTGSNIQRQAQEKGTTLQEADEATAIAAAAVQAPLDAISDRLLIGRLLPPGAPAGVVRRIVGEGVVKHAIKGAGAEGLTEAAQQAIEIGQANPEKLFDFSPEVQAELADAAIAGGFLGGAVGAAGVPAGKVADYYRARPFRQLQQDLEKEGFQNADARRRGNISQTAEQLRQYNVEGPVDIIEEEFDGLTKFTIKSPSGNSFGRFENPEDAASAIDIYSRATGAKVSVKKKPSEAAPSIKPIRIGKKKYTSFEEIRADRDNAIASREAIAKFVTDPDLLKSQAAAEKVPEEFYRREMFKEVQRQDKIISRLNSYLPETKTEEAVKPAAAKTASKAIPYDTVSFDEKLKSKVYSSGESPVIDYGGRKITVKNINGVDVPFYLSSGFGGKKDVPAGKWYPFFGIGKNDGWINKTGGEEMASYYGSPELKAAAEELDAEFGDIRNDQAIPKVGPTGQHIDYINRGFDPADNNSPDTIEKVRKNIDATIAKIRTQEALPTIKENPVETPIGFVAPPQEEVIGKEAIVSDAVKADEAKAEVVPPQKTEAPPEPRPYTPEYKEKMDRVYEALNKDIKNIAPPEVSLKLVELINSKPGILVRGAFRQKSEGGVERVIELSSGIFDPDATVEQMVLRMTEDLNHEIIHALRDSGLFRRAEWNVLSKSALNAKVPGKKYTYLDRANAIYRPNGIPISDVYANEDALIEEAVADMYKDWIKNRQAPQQAQGLLNRVTEFFRRIFRAFRNTRHESVFKAIEAGKLRDRKPELVEQKPEAVEKSLFSASPAVNSDEFRNWFGNSKTVNPDGSPKVFYHGTPFSFKAFGKSRSAKIGGEEGPFFFSESPKFANQYAETRLYKGARGEDVKSGGRVLPVYISTQNPFDYENDVHIAALKGAIGDISPSVENNIRSGMWKALEAPAIQRAIRRLGFDGVYLNEAGFKNLAVYRPEQVKSIFNQFETGAAESARFSAAPALNSEEFKRWFKKSGVVDNQGKPMIVYHHGSFTEDGSFVPRTPMHFGTMSAAKERAFGKRTDDAISAVKAYKNDDGLWHWDDGQGYTSEDVGEPGYISEKNAIKAGQTDVASREDYSEVEAEDLGTIVPVYLSLQKMKRVPDVGGASGEWEIEIEKAKSEGYDGIVYKNLYEDKGSNSYIAFYPQQVKSPDSRFSPEAEDIRFSAAPLPPYVEQRNRTLFRPQPDVPFYKSMFDFFFGHPTVGKTLRTVYGDIDVDWKTRFATSARVSGVDSAAYVEYLEKAANQKTTGNFERLNADYSATAALAWFRRSSQLTASVIMMGKPSIKFDRPGDIQSATIAAEEDPDSLMKIFSVLLEPGPADPVTGEPRDKRVVFKPYAAAMRAIGLKAAGKPVPRELDDTYINTTIAFTQANYPEIVEAYKSYQRFNKNLITAARDAGVITSQELASLTQKMDYYGFYREVFEEELVPGATTRMAGKFDLREYKGSEYGNLIDDPMFVIVQNTQFWMNAIARNIATNKAFKLARDMGEARLLGTSEKPDPARGESEQVMFYREAGVTRRFAVSDPMLVTALGSDDRVDMGKAMKIMGMPTQFIRESVTRDPAFMITNLIRDTLSSWITSGEDITPFLGTAAGFAKALKGSASFQALMGRGVVGSYDLAMREPAELAAIMRRRLTPKNVHTLIGPEGATKVVGLLWDRLGVWSEASDAATRIAVYEAAKKQGLSEAEATFRAIQIMDFSRRGSSTTLAMLTKLIPFLNARIQGLDVLWQAGKAGGRVLAGKSLGERDANLGKKFLVRGAMLAAISLALEYMNDDDESYDELPDYIKKSNLLIPLSGFGLEGEFLAIAKPFEAGLLFSTLPQQFYQTISGDVSARDNINFFVESFSSTFGVNPIPQIALPALEIIVNHDFYTGLPLISEGKARLSPELQYDSRTSTVARMLGDIPIKYNFTTGKFEGISPIVIDQLIGGYGGPFGTLIASGVGMAMEGVDIGPERLPRDFSQMPVIRRFFVDAESRSPKTVSQAYELFRIVDEANRSFSRLRQSGDAEAVLDYLDENRNVLAYKKYIYKLVDSLNKLSAQERQIERDKTMTDDEKREAMNRLREARKRLTAKVGEINKALGR